MLRTMTVEHAFNLGQDRRDYRFWIEIGRDRHEVHAFDIRPGSVGSQSPWLRIGPTRQSFPVYWDSNLRYEVRGPRRVPKPGRHEIRQRVRIVRVRFIRHRIGDLEVAHGHLG